LDVLRSGNVKLGRALSVLLWSVRDTLRRSLRLQPVPAINGKCAGPTPSGRIHGLQVGDWVEVRSKEEIEATLNRHHKNRGLWFDIEMLAYCGRKMRLLKKVDRIVEERTGALIELPNDCWIIEGAACTGHISRRRLFCTRKIYPYWREI
jgi:hypothetical protein